MSITTSKHESRQPRRRKQTRRLSGWRLFFVLLLFMLSLLIAVRGAIAWRHSSELQARADAGIPTTVEAYRAWRSEGNVEATELYREAFDALQLAAWTDQERLEDLIVAGAAELPPLGEPLPQARLDVAKEFLADHAAVLPPLHAAAEIGNGMGPWRLESLRKVTELGDLSEVRKATNLLCMEAMLATEEGDAEGAVAALEAASHVVAMLDHEHFAIDLLVQIGCSVEWSNAAARVTSRLPLEDAQLVRLMEAAQRLAGSSAEFSRMLVAEDAYVSLYFKEEGREAFADFLENPDLDILYRIAGIAELDELARWQRFQDLRDVYGGTSDEAERYDEFIRRANVALPNWAVYSSSLMPVFEHLLQEHYRSMALKRATLAGLAVLRYDQRAGELPERLSQIAPRFLGEVPSDPFTGNPLIYRVLEDGFVVYSVGVNRVDDDGESESGGSADDPAFRVRLPR